MTTVICLDDYHSLDRNVRGQLPAGVLTLGGGAAAAAAAGCCWRGFGLLLVPAALRGPGSGWQARLCLQQLALEATRPTSSSSQRARCFVGLQGRKEKAVTALDPRAQHFDLMYEQASWNACFGSHWPAWCCTQSDACWMPGMCATWRIRSAVRAALQPGCWPAPVGRRRAAAGGRLRRRSTCKAAAGSNRSRRASQPASQEHLWQQSQWQQGWRHQQGAGCLAILGLPLLRHQLLMHPHCAAAGQGPEGGQGGAEAHLQPRHRCASCSGIHVFPLCAAVGSRLLMRLVFSCRALKVGQWLHCRPSRVRLATDVALLTNSRIRCRPAGPP